ncbi:MAG: thioredoxin [Acidiferrobacteraceae bacterium]|nr:thioredoxin [Acidiferrobacteraceae bacterium]
MWQLAKDIDGKNMDVNAQTFQTAVIQQSHEMPVLTDFWADWCSPCKMLMPILAGLAEEYAGKLALAKINTDQEQQLASQYGVRSLPTVKLFKNGEVVDEFMGALPESAVRAFIEKHLDRPADNEIAAAMELATTGDRTQAATLLKQALLDDPGYEKISIALAQIQLEMGSLDDARNTLNSLSDKVRFEQPVKTLVARLELAESGNISDDKNELESAVQIDARNLTAREKLGSLYFAEGNIAAAMDQWLEIVRLGTGDSKEAGRKNLLRTFEVLGPANPDVNLYRRRLAQILN